MGPFLAAPSQGTPKCQSMASNTARPASAYRKLVFRAQVANTWVARSIWRAREPAPRSPTWPATPPARPTAQADHSATSVALSADLTPEGSIAPSSCDGHTHRRCSSPLVRWRGGRGSQWLLTEIHGQQASQTLTHQHAQIGISPFRCIRHLRSFRWCLNKRLDFVYWF